MDPARRQVGIRVGMKWSTRKPTVHLVVDEMTLNFSPEDAQRLSHDLSEAATAALAQSYLLEWVNKNLAPLNDQQAMALGTQFLQFCDRHRPPPRGTPPAPPTDRPT